jgi:riboflavin transporter FmnP
MTYVLYVLNVVLLLPTYVFTCLVGAGTVRVRVGFELNMVEPSDLGRYACNMAVLMFDSIRTHSA